MLLQTIGMSHSTVCLSTCYKLCKLQGKIAPCDKVLITCNIFYLHFSDLNKIVDGMGEKLARFIQCFMTFIGAYVIGFIYGWKLTLTLVSMLPLMALSGGIMGMV